MRITEEEFQKLYERTQAAIRRGTARQPEPVPFPELERLGDPYPGPPAAEPQRPVGCGAEAAAPVQKAGAGRFRIRVETARVRLCDPDNLVAKFVIDCCRYAGAIPQDSPEHVEVSVTQKKVRRKDEEETVVTIERISH